MEPVDRWSTLHCSQSNPEGAGRDDVAALLRRVAESTEKLGGIQVADRTFHSEVTGGEDDLTMTAYYARVSRHSGSPADR